MFRSPAFLEPTETEASSNPQEEEAAWAAPASSRRERRNRMVGAAMCIFLSVRLSVSVRLVVQNAVR